MVAGPIPKASIDRHVEGWGIDDAEMFRACIRRMDVFYQTFEPSKPGKNLEGLSPQERITAIFGDKVDKWQPT